MRRVVVSMMSSLDGYVEGPGHNVMALPFDAGFSAYNLARLRTASTLLLGRTSYEGFRSYWPTVEDDESQPEGEREISRRNKAIEKVVISDTLAPDPTAPWADSTRIVPRAGAVEAVAELKRQPGEDILVFGSRTMWNGLLDAGLVDELHVTVGPALLGAGSGLYAGSSPVPLSLLEARVLEGSQLILARYAATG